MTRLLLIILLFLSSSPVYAEWVAIVANGEAGVTVYVDPATIRRNSNLVKMWQLSDFKTAQTIVNDSYLSFKMLSEYDCAEERTRSLALTNFSRNMGAGKVIVSASDEGRWEPVRPDSIAERLWRFACGKP
jgi:hypothetical protein